MLHVQVAWEQKWRTQMQGHLIVKYNDSKFEKSLVILLCNKQIKK